MYGEVRSAAGVNMSKMSEILAAIAAAQEEKKKADTSSIDNLKNSPEMQQSEAAYHEGWPEGAYDSGYYISDASGQNAHESQPSERLKALVEEYKKKQRE